MAAGTAETKNKTEATAKTIRQKEANANKS